MLWLKNKGFLKSQAERTEDRRGGLTGNGLS